MYGRGVGRFDLDVLPTLSDGGSDGGDGSGGIGFACYHSNFEQSIWDRANGGGAHINAANNNATGQKEIDYM